MPQDAGDWRRGVWDDVLAELKGDSRVTIPLRVLLKSGSGNSPISPEVINQALKAKDWDLGDEWDLETTGSALQLAQIDWIQRSGSLTDYVYTQSITGLDLIGWTRSRIYIADTRGEWEGRPIGGIVSGEIQRLLRYTHKLQAAADGVVDEDVIEKEDMDIIVLHKPKTWQIGESTAIKDLTYVIRAGATPPEALDYWMVERVGVPQSQWAKQWRERGPGTVSRNIDKAKKKLRENRPDLLNPEKLEIPESNIMP